MRFASHHLRIEAKTFWLNSAFGVGMNGLKEVLGIWSSDNEGAKLWMQVITELKTRGVQDIFIACVDAVSKVFLKPSKRFYPNTQIQSVHRASGSALFVLRLAQRPQRSGERFENDLSSSDAR